MEPADGQRHVVEPGDEGHPQRGPDQRRERDRRASHCVGQQERSDRHHLADRGQLAPDGRLEACLSLGQVEDQRDRNDGTGLTRRGELDALWEQWHRQVVDRSRNCGGQLFGFFGILLALPAAAVLSVIVRFAYNRYLKEHPEVLVELDIE